jgi:hypothetical protein
MLPGAGYEPHVDAYDVAIFVVSGKVETLGQVVEPNSVIFYSAGEPHGMKNVGQEPAKYLVFEMHGPGSSHVVRAKGLASKAGIKEALKLANSELKASRAQARKLENELIGSQKEVSKLKAQLSAMINSRSWRLTAPLRFVFKRIRTR